jgi:hypothetical protein
MEVRLIAPAGATIVEWRKVLKAENCPKYGVGPDGIIAVPAIAAHDLIEIGCKLPEGATLPERDILIRDAEDHELEDLLRAHNEAGHYFEYRTHIQSAKLRGDEPLTAEDRKEIADQLDSLFRLARKGQGRIVAMPTEDKRARARQLAGIA